LYHATFDKSPIADAACEASQGEILDGPLGVDAPERTDRHIPRAEKIMFCSEIGHGFPL
jgi:hypothetical protein